MADLNMTEALARFEQAAEPQRRAAFECLCSWSRPVLVRMLRREVAAPDAREDLAQEALLRVWERRDRFRNLGLEAWFQLLLVTARRCHIDRARREAREVPAEPDVLEACTPAETPLETALLTRALAEELEHQAHCLWLGLEPELSPAAHTRQLLAAQLFYLEGAAWDEILDVLTGAPPGPASGEPRLTRTLLDRWLGSPGVLRLLAYAALYLENEALAGWLLGQPGLRREELAELARQAEAPGTARPPEPWTWPEVRVLLWRYGYGCSEDQVQARTDSPVRGEELEALLVRFREALPFRAQMLRLLSIFSACGLDPHPVFRAPGLWQRLAFQYWYHDELSLRDVQERVASAAEQGGYSVTPGALNVWLSGGRLLGRLARFCAGDTEYADE